MATLKSLVDETSNIKNELVECHTNLKNSLIAKGVECSDSDKMSSLIHYVSELKVLSECVAGDSLYVFVDNPEMQIPINNGYQEVKKFSNFLLNGNYRVSASISSTTSGNTTFLKIIHKRNNATIFTSNEFSTKSTTVLKCSVDISNILVGDTISFQAWNNNSSYARGNIKEFAISCDCSIK